MCRRICCRCTPPAGQKGGFRKTIAHLAQAEPEQIYGMDLCVYNGEPGRIWGPEGEFVSSGVWMTWNARTPLCPAS